MNSPMILHSVNWDALTQCTFVSWQPKIGDPNFTGWLTVVFYLLTFGLCVAVTRFPGATRRAVRVFWLPLCFLMLFLAINKQLDLQSLATASARCLAKLQGWYNDRAAFQLAVIAGLGLAALMVGLYFFWMLRRDLRRNYLALLGLIVVLAFVMIRAVGFHYFDVLIGLKVGPVHMNTILEFSGLVLISLNAIMLLKSGEPERSGRRRRRSQQTKKFRRDH